jgi:D-alanyl-D-alanine carboxypeptidase/D-alanyl-D-alanine-endopeptidase (penicillin-binding protein 4)
MKTNKPSLKKITNQFLLAAALLLLSALINTGCKLSYDDISLGEFKNDTGEIREFPGDNYGYVIYDIESEKIVKGHNANREFTPASVTKLLTALFAAETLGYDYKFSTTLSYDGKISDNVLTGNIYITGSGDPEISINELRKIADALKSEDIKEVKGNFYFDETLFTPREKLDQDMPDDGYYNAGLSPLSFNSNIIYVLKKTDSEGKITSINLLPSLPGFNSNLYSENISYPYFRYKFSERKESWGFPLKNIWDNRQQLPVKHPGLYTAQTFQKLCEIRGIKLPSPENGKTPSSAKNIFELKSGTLSSIIKNMLFTSNNMTAEILYTVTSDLYKRKTEDKNPMENFYKNSFSGIAWNNFRIVNASGLTSLNKLTPEQTAAVLLYIEKKNNENFKLEDILPVSGWEGTMRTRLDQPESAFRVYGKTGSIFYASGLAGLFYAKSGKRYIFSIYINDDAGRSEYDAKISKTVEDLNRGGVWTKKASSAIDEFILKMIEQL